MPLIGSLIILMLPKRGFKLLIVVSILTILLLILYKGKDLSKIGPSVVNARLKSHPRKLYNFYKNPSSGEKGRTFNSSNLKALDIVRKPLFKVKFTDIKSMNQDQLVFVTAASRNHFLESKASIQSVQRFFPRNRVIYYDLGLDKDQQKAAQLFCGVEYKVFNFSAYPAHVKKLKLFAWKPLIIMEELLAHQGLFYFDASIRFKSNAIKSAMEKAVANRGIVQFTFTSHNNFPVTAPGLYEYVPSDVSLLKSSRQYSASSLLLFLTEWMFERVYWPYWMCALERECIAPIANAHCEWTAAATEHGAYAGCHRFDQSLINVLLLNAYNNGTLDSRIPTKRPFFYVQRRPDVKKQPKYCTKNGTMLPPWMLVAM